MAQFVIQLNEKNGVSRVDGFDWIPALVQVARDIQEINQYVDMLGLDLFTGLSAFPRPITCNPDILTWIEESEGTPGHWDGPVEKVLGDLCTPPTVDGFVCVRLDNYEYINFRFLTQIPTSFFVIGGIPTHAGKII